MIENDEQAIKPEAAGALAGEESSMSRDDLCRLSRVFNAHNNLRLDQDRRINEWLGDRIATAALSAAPVAAQQPAKDVHTEHCCASHGCKYGDEDCTVTTGRHPQSYPCEECDETPAQQPAVVGVDDSKVREALDVLQTWRAFLRDGSKYGRAVDTVARALTPAATPVPDGGGCDCVAECKRGFDHPLYCPMPWQRSPEQSRAVAGVPDVECRSSPHGRHTEAEGTAGWCAWCSERMDTPPAADADGGAE